MQGAAPCRQLEEAPGSMGFYLGSPFPSGQMACRNGARLIWFQLIPLNEKFCRAESFLSLCPHGDLIK